MYWTISKGERGVLEKHVLTIGSVIALFAGGLALSSLIFQPGGISGNGSLLGGALLQEWSGLFLAWSVAVGLMALMSSYVMSKGMVREMNETTGALVQLGSAPGTTSRLLLTRLLVVTVLAFVLGLSMGLVAAQLAYRGVVVLSGSFYSVPLLGLAQVAEVAAVSFVSCLLGGVVAVLRSRKGR